MSQITTGVRSVLSNPSIYNLLQNLLGAKSARSEFIVSYCQVFKNQSLLDIGCGTAELLYYLPDDIVYSGYDISKKYIDFARENHNKKNATFYAELVTENTFADSDKFDRVVASGLLHHISDEEVISLFKIVKKILGKNGQFISIDPCYVAEQKFISKALINRDRGNNVRSLNEYSELAKTVFASVELIHRNNMLRIPYDHVILRCK
jgi:SAM-dependent methyltransferase